MPPKRRVLRRDSNSSNDKPTWGFGGVGDEGDRDEDDEDVKDYTLPLRKRPSRSISAAKYPRFPIVSASVSYLTIHRKEKQPQIPFRRRMTSGRPGTYFSSALRKAAGRFSKCNSRGTQVLSATESVGPKMGAPRTCPLCGAGPICWGTNV